MAGSLLAIVGRGTRTCSSLAAMTMPTDVGIIDLMLGIPEGNERDWYEFLQAAARDEESKDYEFPAQYMFKEVPAPRRGRRPRRRRRSS